jgi:phospholipid/cholesterol/gamma-HCH transport system permease protein
MLDAVGRLIISLLAAAGDASLFAMRAARELFTPPFEVRETIRQLYELGLRSAPLIAVSGVAVGVVLSMHTRASLERFGAESMIPAGLAIALVRETGPLTAGLLLSGRIGAGIGAELGAMRVTEQIDALESLGRSPSSHLVIPRVLAGLLMIPALTVLANLSGIVSGWVSVKAVLPVTDADFIYGAQYYWRPWDAWYSVIKAFFFAGSITIISCYMGFNTKQGAEGVGRSTTTAVVTSSVLILVLDTVLTRLLLTQ